jgi:hypothetical protein
MNTGYLRIYMDDQLALGILWRETARRAASENEGTELGDALERVATAIAEDVDTFERLMDRLAFRRSTVKPLLATAAERVGRFKPNGHLRGYSPLSRFDELDFLTMGIDGKRQLWATLRDLAELGERLPDVDFDGLIERAVQQRELLEPFRVEAGREALAGRRAQTTA